MIFFSRIIFFLYSNLSSIIEVFFLKKKKGTELLKNGFYNDKLKIKLDYNNLIEKKIFTNNSFEKLIIDKKYIVKIIKNLILENDIKNKLYEITGFYYSIDFFLAYTTHHIDEDNLKKDIYANHWHKDKPYSKNTLKIIIPIDEILHDQGPMEIISIEESNKVNFFSDLKNVDFNNKYKLIGTNEDVYYFLSNLCYHKAGVPFLEKKRTQIMFQLNPSNNWKYSDNLYKKQYLMEPKFPLFNFKDKYISI